MTQRMTHDTMEFMVQEQIGPNRALLPNGTLLCRDVPLARTGIMLYADGETPVRTGARGYVEIERSPDEVFAPASLASYSAADLVDEHPPEDVSPQNWRALSHGVVLNARRGDKELSEFVVGDIVIKSPELIEAVQQGKREVSVGYLCDYDEMEPGKGRQRNIVVNHVALVERGRCGARCAIGDKANPEIDMTAKTLDTASGGLIKRALDKLRATIKTKDEAAIEKELTGIEAMTDLAATEVASPPKSEVHIHLGDEFEKKAETDDTDDPDKKDGKDNDPYAEKFAAIDAALAKIMDSIGALTKGGEKTDGVDEKMVLDMLTVEVPTVPPEALKVATKDSSVLENAFIETVSLAEVLSPGLQPPAFDRALPPSKTFDGMCKHRREALKRAAENPAMTRFIMDGLRGKTFDTMTCDETRSLFRSAATVKATINNAAKTTDTKLNGGGVKAGPIKSIAELNAFAKEHYKTA